MLLLLLRFSSFSSHSVDMPFEIAGGDQFRQHILLKGGYSTGVKTEFFLERRQELFGKYHVAHTYGGGNGFGKGV